MPMKPLRPCTTPGCSQLVSSGKCEAHRKADDKQYDQRRGSATARGYDARWRSARLSYLSRHPLCASCEKDGLIEPATVVDHVKPHKGDVRLFWDVDNWQPLCKRCHDRKTATEDGRWG